MKALTLHQPWATLIAAGVKTTETRSWRPPGSLIGHKIALHAGKQVIKSRNGLGAGTSEIMNTLYGTDWSDKIPRGAVVATARLADARRVLALDLKTGTATLDKALARTVQADPYGDFSRGRWLWFLEDVQPCNPPVPAKGAQGLWNWEPEEGDQAQAQDREPTAEEQEGSLWTPGTEKNWKS